MCTCSLEQHPWRWLASLLGLLSLLLLILLCALLIPRRHHANFAQPGPALVAVSASSMDLNLTTDRPAWVYYAVAPAAAVSQLSNR